jgi:hypothetical protein
MKDLILMLMACFFSMTAFAQELKDSKVPAPVMEAFKKQYPGIKATWEKEKNVYEASFKKGGQDISVTLNETGEITETETGISIAALPAGVASYIKEHYKNEKIKEAAKIVSRKGAVTYEAEIKGKDLIFDANGKFLKEVSHNKDDEEDNDRK